MEYIKIIFSPIISIIEKFAHYFSKPKLTVELEIERQKKIPNSTGLGSNNMAYKDIFKPNTKKIKIDLQVNFYVKIINNSDFNAFFTEIEFNNEIKDFIQIDKLNEPISKTKSKSLKAVYSKTVERTTEELLKDKYSHQVPKEFNNIALLLSYKNSKDRQFYTKFDNSLADKEKNIFLRKKPKEYKKNC